MTLAFTAALPFPLTVLAYHQQLRGIRSRMVLTLVFSAYRLVEWSLYGVEGSRHLWFSYALQE